MLSGEITGYKASLKRSLIDSFPYGMKGLHKGLGDFKDNLSAVHDYFAGNMVEFVSDGGDGMFVPALL